MPKHAWFSIALRPWKPEGSLGRTAQDGHLNSHTAPELWKRPAEHVYMYVYVESVKTNVQQCERPALLYCTATQHLCVLNTAREFKD